MLAEKVKPEGNLEKSASGPGSNVPRRAGEGLEPDA